MQRRAVFWAMLVLFTFAGLAFIVTKWVFPGRVNTLGENLLLMTTALGGVAAFFSALKDLTDFIKDNFHQAGWLPSNYKKTYLQHLHYRHRNFDVKGLTTQGTYTLELTRVFVELSIAPRPPHEVGASPIQLPETLRQGRHTVWDFLAQSDQSFAIIGPPGSGKTTLLKNMTLTMGNKLEQKKQAAPAKLPVLLFLRNHIKAIVNATDELPYSLEKAIQRDLKKWDKTAPVGWFKSQLDQGRCLVMLDGLDEVADVAQRQQVVAWVERMLQAHGRNRFIVTSRPHGYRSNPLTGISVLEVRPFTISQQKQFIENWYLANEIQSQQKNDEGVHMDAAEGAADLLQRLQRTPKLAELAVNPLLLTMIATVHKYRSSLPGRRVELHAEICEVFLGKRQQAKGLTLDITPAQRQRVLQPLAWHMMLHRWREIDAERAAWVIKPVLLAIDRSIEPNMFLKSIEQESGLLLERESGEFAFAHLTFQEFLAAAHAQDQQLLEDLLPHVGDSWWNETILLFAARVDAAPIIEACLAGDGMPDVKALLLAMDCAEEAREVRPVVQQRLERILDETVEGDDFDRIRLISKARLRRRLQKFMRLSEAVAIDTSLITCAEYQLFLDDMRALNKFYQPDHWLSENYPAKAGNLPVTGVRPSDAMAFCEWLVRDSEEGMMYRLPWHSEIDQAIVGLKDIEGNFGYWIQAGKSFEVMMAKGERPAITMTKFRSYLDVAGDLASNLVGDLNRALALDFAGDLAHSLDSSDDLALARALASDLDRALAGVHDLARARDRAHELARAHVRDRDSVLTRILAQDSGISSVLDRAHARARDLARSLGSKHDHARDLARDLHFDLTRVRPWILKNVRALSLVYNLNLGHALVRDLNLDLARDLRLKLARDLSMTNSAVRGKQRNLLLWIGVNLLLFLQDVENEESEALRRLQSYKMWKQELQGLAEKYLGLFADLCVLEERIVGTLPAFEGIRLVREVVAKKKGRVYDRININ